MSDDYKPTTKRIQLDIPEDLHARFKSTCTLNRTTMSAVLTAAVEKFLADYEKEWQKYGKE